MPPTTTTVSPDSLHAEFGDAIAGFLANRVRDPETVKDLSQEVFLKVYRQLRDGSYRVRDPRAWIHSIARNTLVDHFRRHHPKEPLPADLAYEEATDPSPAERDLQKRLKHAVQCFLESLPDTYREAVRLADFDGLTQPEIARRLGISLPNAKARVQRGRARMKELLLDCCAFELSRDGTVLDYRKRTGTPCCPDPS